MSQKSMQLSEILAQDYQLPNNDPNGRESSNQTPSDGIEIWLSGSGRGNQGTQGRGRGRGDGRGQDRGDGRGRGRGDGRGRGRGDGRGRGRGDGRGRGRGDGEPITPNFTDPRYILPDRVTEDMLAADLRRLYDLNMQCSFDITTSRGSPNDGEGTPASTKFYHLKWRKNKFWMAGVKCFPMEPTQPPIEKYEILDPDPDLFELVHTALEHESSLYMFTTAELTSIFTEGARTLAQEKEFIGHLNREGYPIHDGIDTFRIYDPQHFGNMCRTLIMGKKKDCEVFCTQYNARMQSGRTIIPFGDQATAMMAISLGDFRASTEDLKRCICEKYTETVNVDQLLPQQITIGAKVIWTGMGLRKDEDYTSDEFEKPRTTLRDKCKHCDVECPEYGKYDTAMNSEYCVLLRVSHFVDGVDIDLPSGSRRIGESALECCQREVLEEVGIAINIDNDGLGGLHNYNTPRVDGRGGIGEAGRFWLLEERLASHRDADEVSADQEVRKWEAQCIGISKAWTGDCLKQTECMWMATCLLRVAEG